MDLFRPSLTRLRSRILRTQKVISRQGTKNAKESVGLLQDAGRDRPCFGFRQTGRGTGKCPRRPRCGTRRPEEHTSELQSLMRISYAVFCLKKKQYQNEKTT